jgi:hypothetical protein
MPTFNIEKTDSQYVVTWRHFSVVIIFLFVFLLFWTYICVSTVHAIINKQQFGLILFALPFWAFWIVIFGLIVNMLFGETRFILDKTGLESTWTCLAIKRAIRIELHKIQRFERLAYRNGIESHFLRVVCKRNNVDVSTLAWDKEVYALCDQLNIFLGTLKGEKAGVPAKWEMPSP